MTMRTRKMGPPIANTGRCIRYTTLTCLICQTLAYRVQQLVPLDIDGQEGPLLPSLDWVELETLKSLHGWVEIHSSCLVSTPPWYAQSPLATLRLPFPARACDMSALPSSPCLASPFHFQVPVLITPCSY